MIENIKAYLADNEPAMFRLLERLVNINSHSANPDGVNRVVDVLETVMRKAGFATRRMANSVTGDNLLVENGARRDHGGGALLVGHMDTVFPPEMGFDTFHHDGDIIAGPGVCDMKGGLVIGIYALKALIAAGHGDMPLAFFFNADEEIGSPHSRDLIVEAAGRSDFCLVLEGDGLGGEVVIGRKGRRVFDVTVEGQPYHAGHCGFPKPNAIVEMAHKIAKLEALNSPDEGTSLNVGQIEGGVGPNTVAARCTARMETRHVSMEIRDRVWTDIERIIAESTLEGTTASMEIITSRPPMVPDDVTTEFYSLVESAGREVGVETKPVFRGGGSDANTVAQTGIPVLDGLGPSGAKFHTPDEFIYADSLVKQASLTAVSILRAAEKFSA